MRAHLIVCFSFLSFHKSVVLASVLTARNTAISCNNSPDLCNRSYSNITHLGAHDSPFVSNSSSKGYSLISVADAANQDVNSTAQLTAGVRLLSAQVHKSGEDWHLCHTSCSLLDVGTLSSWLAEIKSWLDVNPHDVVTLLLVNTDNATAADLKGQYVAANITSYAYTPPSSTSVPTTWPTLQDMISKNARLVTFVASLTPSQNTVAPYLLDEFTFVFENPYNVTSLSNFSCTADRPASVHGQTAEAVSSGRLPLVNHFLDTIAEFGIQIPDAGNISTTNGLSGTGSLGLASEQCTTAYGKKPNFLLVDYFDHGSALEVVDGLNGISGPARGPLPSKSSPSPSSSTPTTSSIVNQNSSDVRRSYEPSRMGWSLVGSVIFWALFHL